MIVEIQLGTIEQADRACTQKCGSGASVVEGSGRPSPRGADGPASSM